MSADQTQNPGPSLLNSDEYLRGSPQTGNALWIIMKVECTSVCGGWG